MTRQSHNRILLTGPTGAVGDEVLKILSRVHGFRIRILDQDKKSVRRILSSFTNIEKVYGQLNDKAIVNQACKEVDAVIHLGALIPPRADKETMQAWQTNVQGTHNVIEAMQRHNPGGSIIYASSISVYGDRVKNPWIRVSDPLLPSKGDYYAETKIEAENLLRESGLKWTIFRVSAVMGSQTKMSSLFFHMPLDTSLEIVTAKDAGRAFVKALDYLPELNHKIYNLSGGPDCRILYLDFLKKGFAIKGLKRPDFPREAFANQNFHCGYYSDGSDLQEIIRFQKDNLADYYNILEQQQNKLSFSLIQFLSPVIKKILLLKSDPLKAFRQGSGIHFKRYFNIIEK